MIDLCENPTWTKNLMQALLRYQNKDVSGFYKMKPEEDVVFKSTKDLKYCLTLIIAMDNSCVSLPN